MPTPSRLPHKPEPVLPPGRPYAALPLLWAAVVLILTLTPANEMPHTPNWELLSFDTAAHAGVFVVLAGLSWFSVKRQRRWPRLARHAGLVVFVGSTLFGGLIEVLQMTMRLGRHGDWTDLLSDAIGAGLTVGLATAWTTRQQPRTRPLASIIWFGVVLAGAGPTLAHAQDMLRARRTIEKLTSPALHGRGYVQQGEHNAAAYLRSRLRDLKLEPLAPNYTQSFTLNVNTFPGKVKMTLVEPAPAIRATVLTPGTDFIVLPDAKSINATELWVSRLDTVDLATNETQLTWLKTLRQHPASGRAVLSTARVQTKYPSLPPYLRQAIDSSAVHLELVPKLIASLSSEQANQTKIAVLENAKYWTAGGGTLKLQLQIEADLKRNYQTQNLAALIRGTAQPDSFLVVSAHYDHLGMMGKNVYFPGANDNASGVALLLELAAHYALPKNRLAYSIVFLLFGAEEAGLVGSSHFVAHPLIPLKSIKFLVNLDLLGTGEQGATVVNGRVLEAPYRRLVTLNEAHHYLPQLAPRGRAANSDHAPFFEAGVPAFFIYTRGGSTAYHDVNDRPEALSLAGFAGAFGLVRDFIGELGAAPTPKK
ncbi:VanZ family protein [Hymenobacter terrenus]|uniref:VanZ family protein n=1 Tax=Hymenobacter terrenus TaxID=1629124 RepID=UPI0009E58D31|nr:VanZ family protein [Hymenobacter terrenus]